MGILVSLDGGEEHAEHDGDEEPLNENTPVTVQ